VSDESIGPVHRVGRRGEASWLAGERRRPRSEALQCADTVSVETARRHGDASSARFANVFARRALDGNRALHAGRPWLKRHSASTVGSTRSLTSRRPF